MPAEPQPPPARSREPLGPLQPAPAQRPEQRAAERYHFPAIVYVAEWDGQRLPPAEAFQRRRTRDLSASGIAFYAPEPPQSDRLVVMLGDHRKPVFVAARVARFHEGYFERRRQFLVGCQLVERLQ